MQQDFLDAMSKAGIAPSHQLIFDGKLRRFRVIGDKKGRKNGWYRYTQVTNEYAWGVYGCNKRSISDKWSSKEGSRITDYERKQQRVHEKKIRLQEEELRGRAAKKANTLWGWLREAEANHPYLQNRSVNSYGLRQLNNALVVPMYVDNYLVSVQFIYPDGMKRYLTGGQKEGAYFWIGGDTKTIYIAEGYATGASIHAATAQQVVICFDAGNMPLVAKMLRGRAPEKQIIIASDNDQWSKGNPGYSKAQEAAKEVGAEIRLPPFSYEDKSMPTDWNDYQRLFGVRALCEELLGINKVLKIEELRNQENLWRLKLIEGKVELPGYKNFDGKSKQNAFLFLENHEKFKDMVVYNAFADQYMLVRCPPWEKEEKFMPRCLEDIDGFGAAMELEVFGIKVRDTEAHNAMRMIAKDKPVNPPMQYFESLRWDGMNRLDTWLTYYLGAEMQSTDYLRLIGAKWMIAGAKRVYEPGCKFDNVLILEGQQGIRKTSALRALATFNGEPYFLEFSGSISGRDALMPMHGKLIVEMSELSTLRKSEIEEMRGFISRQVDEYRPPYGRRVVQHKRYFILAATTNNTKDDGYLLDPTGNRRYWPVECSHIDLEALEQDKEQLWAEAVYRYKRGDATWIQDDEKIITQLEQSAREEDDVWIEPVRDYLVGVLETSVNKVAAGIGLTTEQKNTKNNKRIIKCLRDLGWLPDGRVRTDDGRIRLWRKTDV